MRLLFTEYDRVMYEHMWHVNTVMSDVQLEFLLVLVSADLMI